MEIENTQQAASEPRRPIGSIIKQYTEPFRHSRIFLYLWLGQLISFLGSSITMIILPVFVYSLTGSTTTMGLVMAVYTVPNIVMLPLSGWIETGITGLIL